jgi:hypothetical protein
MPFAMFCAASYLSKQFTASFDGVCFRADRSIAFLPDKGTSDDSNIGSLFRFTADMTSINFFSHLILADNSHLMSSVLGFYVLMQYCQFAIEYEAGQKLVFMQPYSPTLLVLPLVTVNLWRSSTLSQ